MLHSSQIAIAAYLLLLNPLSTAGICPQGDLNADCTVDFHDLHLLCQQWLDYVYCSDEPNCPDLDRSGRIDMTDFALTASNWRKKWPRLLISEFSASNQGVIHDGHGDDPDWIEIFNPSDQSISLDGWRLTDNPDNLNKWAFPDSITLQPGQYHLLFASGKTKSAFPENYPYVDPAGYLHTNFSLSAAEGYLALVRPDQTISCEYAPTYPPQYEDISYGMGGLSDTLAAEHTLIDEFCPAAAIVPTDGSFGLDWTNVEFDDSLWLTGKTAVGYDNQTTYDALIGLDVSNMHTNNGSVYIRIRFEVDDPSIYDSLLLRMKYDDGFIAYLNGVEADSVNPPADPRWNSISEGGHPDAQAVEFVDFDISDFKDALQVGTNVLAIHGVNNGASSSDLLILPKLTARYTTAAPASVVSEGYFPAPTPGEGNGPVTANIGPRITDVTKNPPPPADPEDIVVTASVHATGHAVQSVTLHYRINYDPETSVQMNDNNADGIFTATIPSSSIAAGDMIRWYIRARDIQGDTSRYPLFPDPLTSDQYLGTVAKDPSVVTEMPVLYWFLEPSAESAANTRTGTRTSLFYNGEFYDNVFVRIRGGSIAGLNKKSYKFEFNTANHFRFDPRFGRVDEININTTYTDKAYLRQPLSFETYDWAGLPAPESFLIRLQRNAEFFSVAAFIEQPDKDMLKREGLDENGALYKMYNGVTSAGGQKKTRRWEDNSDLQALVGGISNLTGADRTNFIFDNIDIPAVLNFLAASVLIQHDDDSRKNYYLYRDTDGSGEWMYLPWDLDLTLGKHYMANDGILTDVIWAVEDYILGGRNKNVPIWPSHPFVDTQQTPGNRSWNHLTDALLNTPLFVEMYRRRLRTLMDEILQPPQTETHLLRYENRILEMANRIAPDVELDRAKWGWHGSRQPLAEAVDIMIHQYLQPRRMHLFVTHNADNTAAYNIPNSFSAEIPDSQPDTFTIDFGQIEFNPASTNQDEEFIELINPNNFAADISGWRLTGGVEFTFEPGTVIRAGAAMYLSPDVRAFRARSTSPTGGQARFVQGNYAGHLSNWPETLTLLDNKDRIVSTVTYEGVPGDVQRYLRITEIMYHPVPGADYDQQDYEFIELRNTGNIPLSLTDVKFTEGITYAFAANPDISLAPGEYVLLVKNKTAFESRYGAGFNVAGEYFGYLDNAGETLKLEDATNSTVLEFAWDDDWYSVTDGRGFSLTFRDPGHTDRQDWDKKSSWRPSTHPGGSPGADDAGDIPAPGAVVINEVLAHSDTDPNDWIELHNTTDQTVNISGWFLSDSIQYPSGGKKYEIAEGTLIGPRGCVVFYEATHFANPSDPGCHSPFALSENGDTVYLQSGLDGEFTGYYEEEDFGASQPDTAFGRYQKSTGAFNFVAMSTNTPARPNAYPRVGPVVISEIMYHPAENRHAEYVELHNISGIEIDLFDSDIGAPWKFADQGGIEFYLTDADTSQFITMAGDERILLVKQRAAFDSEFTAPAGTRIFEWDTTPLSDRGSLSNGGEKIQVSMPGDVDESGLRQYIRIDRVVYGADDPWPISPDGLGHSLRRITASDYGNDVANWQASTPTYKTP